MKNAIIFSIRLYKKTVSFVFAQFFGSGCRFTPTCSAYTIEAVEKHGTVKGLSLGVKRFLKCHPWGGFGYDPVPTK